MIIIVMYLLSASGLRPYIDDFGTGNSSLSYPHGTPLDVLKIDQVFIKTIKSNREYAPLVDAIVTPAHNLKMIVTDEGIEEADQMLR